MVGQLLFGQLGAGVQAVVHNGPRQRIDDAGGGGSIGLAGEVGVGLGGHGHIIFKDRAGRQKVYTLLVVPAVGNGSIRSISWV